MEIILNKLGHLPTEFFMLSSHEIGVFAVIRADKDIDVSKLLNLAIAEEYSAEEVKLLTVVEGLVGFEYQFAGVLKLENRVEDDDTETHIFSLKKTVVYMFD